MTAKLPHRTRATDTLQLQQKAFTQCAKIFNAFWHTLATLTPHIVSSGKMNCKSKWISLCHKMQKHPTFPTVSA